MAVGRVVVGARRLVGRDATEARLRAALATVPVVHVAAHGVMNAANPMFSRIALAPGSGSPDDDGRVRQEIDRVFEKLAERESTSNRTTERLFDPWQKYPVPARDITGNRSLVCH